jgi:Zn-dependent M28 family amino/carboxypeptidase
MKKNVQRTAVFIVLLAFFLLKGQGGPVEGRLPADFGTKVKQHIEALVKIGPRRAGTLNEGLAAGYIDDQFKAMGVSAIIEPFAFESYEASRIELKIGGENFTPAGLGMDPYAGGFTYSGIFVLLDPCAPSPGPGSTSVEGKVVVTSEEGDPSLYFRIAALQPRFIIDLSRMDFDRVQGLNDRELSLSIHGGLSKGISRNVIAHLGSNLPAPQIIVGAHMDTFRDCPGANDNASGVAALLELVRHLKDLEIPEGIGLTFVAFGAEEVGILGSRRYVERRAEELRHCSLALVFDDLGGEGPVQVERTGGRSDQPQNPGVGMIPQAYRGRAWGGLRYPWSLLPPSTLFGALGSCFHPDWLAASIDEAIKELKFQVQLTGMQGSDQMFFAQAGIATSGISAVNGRGHTQNDRPETVNIEKVRQCAETADRIIQKTWDHLKPSFPKKPIGLLSNHNPKDNLTRADLMAHVRLLASDELRGRRAGSSEGDIAARYITERLRAAGVEALPGAPDYFQDVAWQPKDASPTSLFGAAGPARGRVPVHVPNVVGFIQGWDGRLAGEFVLLTAHYDHLGARSMNGAETVFNGARDNAMGVAALLAAAEVLAAAPPARSILILATTGEEEGMIGSRFFVDQPLVPLRQIVFVLNNDGAGVYEPELWCIGGLERTTAEPLAEAVGQAYGLTTRSYPEEYRYLYAEGDSISFADKGIPSLTVSPGFTEGDKERIRKYIHTPEDRVDADFDEVYLLNFCRAYAGLARAIADAETVPTWIKGNYDFLGRLLSFGTQGS